LKNIDELVEKLNKIMVGLTLEPTIYYLVKSLRIIITNNPSITGYTDGKSIYLSALRIKKLKLEENDILGVIIHEALHILLEHAKRGQGRNPDLWNIACDLIVNNYTLSILWSNYIYKNLKHYEKIAGECSQLTSADEIYQCLTEKTPLQITIEHDLTETTEEGYIYNEGNPDLYTSFDKNIKELKQHILTLATGKGKTIQLLIKNDTEKLLNWDALIRRILFGNETTPTWSKPNRRIEEAPGYIRTGKPKIYAFIDTSASITDQELEKFIKILQDAVNKKHQVYAAFWDTQISPIYDLTKTKTPTIPRKGETDPKLILKWLEQNHHKLHPNDIIIILTDALFKKEDEEKLLQELPKYHVRKAIIISKPENLKKYLKHNKKIFDLVTGFKIIGDTHE